jgi:hypothetical protein
MKLFRKVMPPYATFTLRAAAFCSKIPLKAYIKPHVNIAGFFSIQ